MLKESVTNNVCKKMLKVGVTDKICKHVKGKCKGVLKVNLTKNNVCKDMLN